MNGEVQQELVKFWRTRVVSRHDRPFNHSFTFHSVVAHSLPNPSRVAGCERRASRQSVMSGKQDFDNSGPQQQEMLELSPMDL